MGKQFVHRDVTGLFREPLPLKRKIDMSSEDAKIELNSQLVKNARTENMNSQDVNGESKEITVEAPPVSNSDGSDGSISSEDAELEALLLEIFKDNIDKYIKFKIPSSVLVDWREIPNPVICSSERAAITERRNHLRFFDTAAGEHPYKKYVIKTLHLFYRDCYKAGYMEFNDEQRQLYEKTLPFVRYLEDALVWNATEDGRILQESLEVYITQHRHAGQRRSLHDSS